MSNCSCLEIKAKNIRKNIIETGFKSKSAHFGGSLSCTDILTYVFSIFKKENMENRDRFILSKGHCALGLYGALAEFNYITQEELHTFNSNGGQFPSHCVKNIEKNIELSSGSLGLGLGYAIGQAIALRKKGLNNKIYVLSGNGEANEGSFWEGCMFIGAKKINNIILILDNNKMQCDGFSKDVLNVSNWVDKFSSFGFEAIEIDGHNFEEIKNAFSTKTDKPIAIIANTIKGKGILFMENNPDWHHGSLNEIEYNQALKELEG